MSGHIIFLNGAAIVYRSKRQSFAVSSTYESDILAVPRVVRLGVFGKASWCPVFRRCASAVGLHLGVCGRSVLRPGWNNGKNGCGLEVDSGWVRLGVCYWRPSTLATGAGAIVSMRSGFALLLSVCVRLSPSQPRKRGRREVFYADVWCAAAKL